MNEGNIKICTQLQAIHCTTAVLTSSVKVHNTLKRNRRFSSWHWHDTSVQRNSCFNRIKTHLQCVTGAQWISRRNATPGGCVSHSVCVRDTEIARPPASTMLYWLWSHDWGNSSSAQPDIHERQQMRQHHAHMRDDCGVMTVILFICARQEMIWFMCHHDSVVYTRMTVTVNERQIEGRS